MNVKNLFPNQDMLVEATIDFSTNSVIVQLCEIDGVVPAPHTNCYTYTFPLPTEPEESSILTGIGTKNLDKKITISLYPNLVKENLTINIGTIDKTIKENITLRITDVSGRIVRNVNLNISNQSEINLTTLPSGNYLYNFIGNNTIIKSGKLVKE